MGGGGWRVEKCYYAVISRICIPYCGIHKHARLSMRGIGRSFTLREVEGENEEQEEQKGGEKIVESPTF